MCLSVRTECLLCARPWDAVVHGDKGDTQSSTKRQRPVCERSEEEREGKSEAKAPPKDCRGKLGGGGMPNRNNGGWSRERVQGPQDRRVVGQWEDCGPAVLGSRGCKGVHGGEG